ncbi:MAG: pyrrolo-quinoline quinone [Verrucomicrobiia bacterium]
MKNSLKFPVNRTGRVSCGFILITVLLLSPRARAANVLTQHNDLARTGAYTSETMLTTANVNTNTFGQLFIDGVDGQVYAQPLYVESLSLSNGTHNVVFVCTENNSVYALDADMGGITYWHTNLGTPYTSGCSDLTPVVGITGTPVIDLNSGTLYVDTKLASGPAHKLHALDIATGSEKFNGPVTISAANFSASVQHQRPGLLLLNGVVYVAFGSHCDQGSYHGFVLGYNATNLTQQVSAFNVTPNGSMGAVWSGGMAPAADASGNIYIMTGNGTFDGNTNFDLSESMIKLNGSLALQDYATPTNWSDLNNGDTDLGSGGVVLLPTHYAVGMGKDGKMYLADVNNMGHVGNFVQVFQAQSSGDTVGKSPVYWQGPGKQYLFALHSYSPTKSFEFTGTNINPTPLGTASFSMNDRCGGLSLSANGTNNGILWEIGSDSNLRAYDAVNFPKLLWTGSVGTYVKMTCPTVANGKVYVGTSSGLSAWGLTDILYSQPVGTNSVLSWVTGTLLETTNLLGPWVTNPAVSPYTVVPTNTQEFYRLLLRGGQ